MTVSVLITSYNHADTLRRAIDSVLMQQTSFEVQVIVVDDCSTDGSVEIIREYWNRDKVSCVEFKEHYGMMRAYAVGLARCEGEYILIADCDDFWVANDKLQRQVEFMAQFPDVSLCVTKVYTERNGQRHTMGVPASYINDHLTYDNLLRGNAYIHAQSYCFRRSALEQYVDFEKFIRLGFKVWDYPIVLELIRHTRFWCMDFYSAVFAKNEESVTQTLSRTRRFRYAMGNHWVRLYYIFKYGCKPGTFFYLIYRLCRDIYAVIFKTWNK